jgi:predicted DNA-binding transcriptional regulator YafY
MPPRKSRGRALSARVTLALRQALAGGRALTYAQLATAGCCSERTVRNYLDVPDALGFPVDRAVGSDHTVRVRRSGEPALPSMERLGRALAGELLRNVFPVAGTDLEVSEHGGPIPIVVCIRGAYEYREKQMRLLRQWLQLATSRPRRAVRFRYDGADAGLGDRIAWPLGMVLRDAARVYLAGVPAEAKDARDIRTYALEWVVAEGREKALDVLHASVAGYPPRGIDSARIEEAIDAPFSVFRPSPDRSVRARVQFSPEQARYVMGRRWHRRQRVSRRADGGVVLELGPVNRDELEAWVRAWGPGARLMTVRSRRSSKTD